MRRTSVLLLGFALASMPAGAQVEPTPEATPVPDLRALLASLARTPPAQTRYVERRESPLLDQPLLFAGQLEQPGAGKLIKTVEGARRERMEIDGDRVRVEREGRRVRSFSLQRAPELSALAASMDALLGGDADALDALYHVRLEHDGSSWRIELDPRDARLRKRVLGMQLLGIDRSWRCLDLQLDGGENSRMWLGDAAARAATSADEAERDALCGGGADQAFP